LDTMQNIGFIDKSQWREAVNEPLRISPVRLAANSSDAFDFYQAQVEQGLYERMGEEIISRYGLHVYTNMDPLLQKYAHQALQGSPHEGALVAIDPFTGKVLALVGGKDFSRSQFNRATQAKRQPGSAFKPFVYGAAIAHGFNPASILHDEKKQFTFEGKNWDPRNYGNRYYGDVPLRRALALSLNAATLDLAERIGIGGIISYARALGIESPIEPSLSAALGSYEVNLLELTAAYAAFANGGSTARPYLIDLITDADGNSLEWNIPDKRQVIPFGQSAMMTSLLRDVVREGTAKSLATLGFTHPAAGKTGTTNQEKDAWFIGYTPRLLCGVWIGDDKATSIELSASQAAIPVWALFMKNALAGAPPKDFLATTMLELHSIDPANGLLSVYGCPVKKEEAFIPGEAPKLKCTDHSGGLKGWFEGLWK
ncbi:MAG: penicillin-binding transpeptidase domain-containing protein, partial [Elusimicrobiota bacterium]